MSDLLKKYEESKADNVEKARQQSEGKLGVNFFDTNDKFSTNFIPRQGKTIQLSNDPETTAGNFTKEARNYYDEELKDITDERFQKYNRNNKYLDNI